MQSNNLYVILHGHFYQPPREDPKTGEIELQPSAYPYHDWNEKIHHQCYAANAASRVLNERGEVKRIVNNYRYISFNFGPTLMSWLRQKDPFTYQRILEADHSSQERNGGHGNAIAQVYNHQILPLSSHQDKITQIEWGLSSFKRDFKRDTEGIWLSETAINQDVVDFLVDYGIRFVILSPTQVEAILETEGEQDVSDGSIDTSQAYWIQGSTGKLAVFFYDSDLARKISFGHLLRNAEHFRSEILNKKTEGKENQLVHVATDGESYGHHEPFGDMCLSRLIDDNEKSPAFKMINYGYFLDLYPPKKTVRLKPGNDGLGTAWSCAHGVDRWRKDCGCHTGGEKGWNQKWREPLRSAFDFLRERLYKVAEQKLNPIFGNVWILRNAFIQVLESEEKDVRKLREDFLNKHAKKKLTKEEMRVAIYLLEALHHEMLMYTSCGWFFSEISGIETVQDMKYAYSVFDLASEFLPPDTRAVFEHILSRAQSNIAEFQNGSWIFNNFVEKHRFTPEKLINEYLLFHILTETDIQLEKPDIYYHFLLNVQVFEGFQKSDWKIFKAILGYENPQLLESRQYITYVFRKKNEIKTYIKKYIDDTLIVYLDQMIEKDAPLQILQNFQDWFLQSYSLSDLKYDTKRMILPKMFENTLQRLDLFPEEKAYREELFEMILLYHHLNVEIVSEDRLAVIDFIQRHLRLELKKLKETGIPQFNFSDLSRLIQVCRKAGLEINTDEITQFIREQISERLVSVVQKFSLQKLNEIEKLIDFSNESGLDFDKYDMQNLIYFRLEDVMDDFETHKMFKRMSRSQFQRLFELGEKFNLFAGEFEAFIRTGDLEK